MIPDSIRLPRLDRVIQAAFGWTNSHLHEFIIGGVHYAIPDPDFPELDHKDERRVTLHKAIGHASRAFEYIYDFGDHWHHIATIGDRYVVNAEAPMFCTAGENACPPEDVGGPRGYADFLKAPSDPSHEEHDNYKRWASGDFDPTRFDIAAANRAIGKLNN